MPFTKTQCAAFAVKAERGEDVPDDWKQQCRSEVVQDKSGSRYTDEMNEEKKEMEDKGKKW